jgi:GT2 family glycosyltransferase
MALTAPARMAEERTEALSGTPLRIAAAVCTRARPEQLRRALESLLAQTPPLAEILVVDNARRDEPTAEHITRAFEGVRYLRTVRGGLDVARNIALRSTDADVVAFLDDDANADPAWAANLLRAFEEQPVAACTGRVAALTLEHPGQLLFEANGGFARGDERIELPRDARRRRLHGQRAPLIAWAVSIGSGCSFAVRREVALAIGGFDERLDDGEMLPGGGDHDMLWRLLGIGCRVVYEPEALAWHEHRTTEHDAIAQIAGHQRALAAFLVKSLSKASLREAPPIAAFLVWRLIKPGLRLLRCAVGRDVLPARALLAIWAECWRGVLAYPRVERAEGGMVRVHAGRA